MSIPSSPTSSFFAVPAANAPSSGDPEARRVPADPCTKGTSIPQNHCTSGQHQGADDAHGLSLPDDLVAQLDRVRIRQGLESREAALAYIVNCLEVIGHDDVHGTRWRVRSYSDAERT